MKVALTIGDNEHNFNQIDDIFYTNSESFGFITQFAPGRDEELSPGDVLLFVNTNAVSAMKVVV